MIKYCHNCSFYKHKFLETHGLFMVLCLVPVPKASSNDFLSTQEFIGTLNFPRNSCMPGRLKDNGIGKMGLSEIAHIWLFLVFNVNNIQSVIAVLWSHRPQHVFYVEALYDKLIT